MLTELYIRNLTLIEELSISFGPGLTVLTGETGAGKSILLDAIFLAIGGRASADQIRDGAAELDVTARFGLEEPTLLLRRVVAKNGRHRQYVNGMPVTVGSLREVAEPLVDFTGQHAQQSLLLAKGQLSLLDAYAGHENLLFEMVRRFDVKKELLLEKERLSLDERSRANRVEWLRYQLKEIDECAPKPGELEELVAERERLVNVAKIQEEGARVLRALEDGDEGDDVLSRMSAALRSLQSLKRFDAAFAQVESRLEEATSLVDDVCRSITKQVHALEEDPGRLSEVEDRIGDIKQLLRKHADTVEEVLSVANQMRVELSTLEAHDENLAIIDQKLQVAKAELLACARALSASRREAAAMLAPLVKKEIADLGMPEAVFEIDLKTNEDEVTACGADSLRMLFSANKGESPNALEKVASGGELSRVMLAIKRVLMTKDATMVSIFDEVDAGVGGAIGHAIGEKLKAISKGRQVLCVTHLAQVAALADAHLKVEKKVVSGRTVSTLHTLSRKERVDELARMMGGKEVTELTREHAHEFLKQAEVAA